MDRRHMLRLGGMAVLGTAGAAVATAAGATPADAAGSKVILGAPNDAGASVTALSSATTEETLQVSNVANGGAIRADSTPTATLPVITSTSSSAHPAVEATGMPVEAQGGVAVAGNGPALSVQGVAAFSRSGFATVPIGQRFVTVNVPGGLTSSSLGFAINRGLTGFIVSRVITDPARGTLDIHTAGVNTSTANVAWFVFG
jgi:hypothetical protein